MDEAHKLGLRTTTHIGVEETTAKDYIELGVNSIEHFYGVADAALDGVQNFPPDMNYSNEIQRFGRAGELYAQADPGEARARSIDMMVEQHVALEPDVLDLRSQPRRRSRAQNLPWFKDYLHPSLEAFFRPSLDNHGSYFLGWTSTQEARWKQQYRIWMDAVREFGRKGGLVTTGDDAGYIYSMYGFGISRELELHEEAGFHPLEVIEHATWNGARLLGHGGSAGQGARRLHRRSARRQRQPAREPEAAQPVRRRRHAAERQAGRPTTRRSAPTDRVQAVHGGGIEWTIKDGIPYHVPTLMREVRDMVAAARPAARRPRRRRIGLDPGSGQ